MVSYSACYQYVSSLASRALSRCCQVRAKTYSVAEATGQMGAPSERWVIERLRAGVFPGRKVGRSWRMTDGDIDAASDGCANDFRCPAADVAIATGLTPRSRKKIAGLGLSATLTRTFDLRSSASPGLQSGVKVRTNGRRQDGLIQY